MNPASAIKEITVFLETVAAAVVRFFLRSEERLETLSPPDTGPDTGDGLTPVKAPRGEDRLDGSNGESP